MGPVTPGRIAASILLATLTTTAPLAAQAKAQGTVGLNPKSAEVSQAAGTAGHRAVFTLTHSGRDTSKYALGCVGLGQVRCAGIKHREVTLIPGGSLEVVAFYEVAEAGRGLLVLTARSSGVQARTVAHLAVRVR